MKHKRILSFFAALLCFSAFGCTPSADSDGSLKYKSVNGLVFGNLMVLTASLFSQNRLTLDAVAESLFDLCADLEAAVSTTNAESSLYAFNAHSSAEPIAVHPMLYDLAVRAQDYYARTDGDFNPAVYPLLKLWGLDAGSINFAHEEVPTPDEIAAVLPLCDYGKVEFYREDGLCYAKKAAGFEGLQLDFGAQSKGYITDRAIELFGAAGIAAASLNIGGNLYVYKSMPAEDMKSFSPWWVSVTDPAAADRRFVSLLCDDEAAVTSGDYERSFTLDGVVYPHILDPHSGIPIGVHYDETENRYVNDAAGLRSVTNFDPSAEKADVYATVGLLRGEARCLAMLEQMNAEDPLFKSLVFTYGTRMVYAAVGGLRRNPDRPGGSIGGYEPVRPGLVL